jgi:homoserine O-acetyltransferase
MRCTVGLGVVIVLSHAVLGWFPVLPTPAAGAKARADTSLVGIEKKSLLLENFRLESGYVFPQVTLAYEAYGALAPDGRNAILITHGYTSSHHAAGKYAPTDATPGWWDRLIGPGKAIDTRRFFVVSSNMLGASHGSTGPASSNPAT